MKMTKTQLLLLLVTAIGTFLVSQGVLSGEQLTSIQNILGIAMGTVGITSFGVIGILNAIPKKIVASAFDKAVETYGEDAVNQVIDIVFQVLETQKENIQLSNTIIKNQEDAKIAQKKLLG